MKFTELSRQFYAFLVTGTINTGLTYLIYLVILCFMNYIIAYSISFTCGVLMSYYMNSAFVFNSTLEFKKALRFVFFYIFQYCLGLILLYFLVTIAEINQKIAPFAVVLVTVPLTFLLSRHALHHQPILPRGKNHPWH